MSTVAERTALRPAGRGEHGRRWKVYKLSRWGNWRQCYVVVTPGVPTRAALNRVAGVAAAFGAALSDPDGL